MTTTETTRSVATDGNDPQCRFAQRNPYHECFPSDPGTRCRYELGARREDEVVYDDRYADFPRVIPQATQKSARAYRPGESPAELDRERSLDALDQDADAGVYDIDDEAEVVS